MKRDSWCAAVCTDRACGQRRPQHDDEPTEAKSKRVAQVKRIRRAVDGIILLDKPKGFSSNAALQRCVGC